MMGATAKKQEEEEGWAAEEVKGMRSEELLRDLTLLRRTRPTFDGLLEDRAEKERRARLRFLQPLLEAEARRRGIGIKDGDDHSKRGADAESVFAFENDDKEVEYAAQRHRLKSSPICSTKKNYGQLDVNTRRSHRLAERRRPIPVDKMYSSRPSSTALYGHTQNIGRMNSIIPPILQRGGRDSMKVHHLYIFERFKMWFSWMMKMCNLRNQLDCGAPDKWSESKIYYPSRDDPEAVELSSSDIKCLDPGVYLSSPVINYYIQYIKRSKLHNEDHRDKFHMFNTYFYSKLQEALSGKGEFSKLRRWWKGVNIFQRGYIILPIHGMAHWSLIIICIPAKESNSGPIILHLDSLGMHPSAEIFDTVGRYLEEEWHHLRKNPPSVISISENMGGSSKEYTQGKSSGSKAEQ